MPDSSSSSQTMEATLTSLSASVAAASTGRDTYGGTAAGRCYVAALIASGET
jgi:hypothetical protein